VNKNVATLGLTGACWAVSFDARAELHRGEEVIESLHEGLNQRHVRVGGSMRARWGRVTIWMDDLDG